MDILERDRIRCGYLRREHSLGHLTRAIAYTRVLLGGRGAISTSIGLVAGLITIALFTFSAQGVSVSEDERAAAALAVLTLAGLLVGTPVIVLLQRRALPAAEYAEVTLGGLPTNIALLVISRHIHRSTEEFYHHALYVQDQVGQPEKCPGKAGVYPHSQLRRRWAKFRYTLFDLPRPGSDTYHGLERQFSRLQLMEWQIARSRRRIQRIDEMLRIAHRDSGITLQQLTDALLFFDPTFFNHVQNNFFANLSILYQNAGREEALQLEPVRADRLLQQNLGAIELVRRITVFQNRTQALTSLLQYTIRIAMTNAASISCLRFSRCAAHIAQSALAQLEGRRRSSSRAQIVEHALTALAHLKWQSRAHVGTDLSGMCHRAARYGTRVQRVKVGPEANTHQPGVELLGRLAKLSAPVAPLAAYATEQEPEALADLPQRRKALPFWPSHYASADEQELDDLIEDLRALVRVPKLVEAGVDGGRDACAQDVRAAVTSWLSRVPETAPLLVVALGTSSTVLHCMNAAIVPLIDSEARGGTPALITVLNNHLDDQYAARFMTNEVRRCDAAEKHKRRHGHRLEVTAGDVAAARDLCTDEHALLVVSGAELLDDQQNVLHRRSDEQEDLFEWIQERMAARPSAVSPVGSTLELVLTEPFKLSDRPSIDLNPRDYDHHLPNVRLVSLLRAPACRVVCGVRSDHLGSDPTTESEQAAVGV